MEFKTAFNRGETTFSPQGSETQPVYEYRIDPKTGKKCLEQCGETNIYEMIQASLESTKLENIIKRATVDPTVLNIREGNYIDISELPTNMIDLQNMILKARAEFNKLPAETRKLFDNSAELYVSSYGSEEWLKKLGVLTEEPEEPVKKTRSKKTEESEVVENE